jgi:hypothetical protein
MKCPSTFSRSIIIMYNLPCFITKKLGLRVDGQYWTLLIMIHLWKKGIDFVRIKFHSNENIERDRMQLEFDSIQIKSKRNEIQNYYKRYWNFVMTMVFRKKKIWKKQIWKIHLSLLFIWEVFKHISIWNYHPNDNSLVAHMWGILSTYRASPQHQTVQSGHSPYKGASSPCNWHLLWPLTRHMVRPWKSLAFTCLNLPSPTANCM